MKQDEIIELAKEARLFYGDKLTEDYAYKVKRFARLVVAKERESCLSIAESMSLSDANMSKTWRTGCRDVAEAIRARGEA